MKTNLSSARRILFIGLVIILSFVSGFLVRDRTTFSPFRNSDTGIATITRDTPRENSDVDFELFWQVWDTIDSSYYDTSQIDDVARVYGAIKGMVTAVGDPYTIFLTPSENKVTQEDLSGNFSGVGIQIGFRGSQLAVVSPLPGSPAESVGIQAGDIIAGIKDEAKDIERGTQGITLPEAVQIIRGPQGSIVTLSLLRDGVDQPVVVDVERQTIDVPSVILTFVGNSENIAHVQVLKFGGETLDEWNEAVLDILSKSDLEGVILDVRNNPGGYMQGAIDLGSDFLEPDDIVVIEEHAKGDRVEFPAENTGRLKRDSLVVLTNGGSASASEILAGALRDNLGTPLIGQNSFGKGTIQEPRQLENGVGLHITIARWLTPDGTWVHETGLTPDIEVENDPDTPEDEQLERAIEYISANSQTAGI